MLVTRSFRRPRRTSQIARYVALLRLESRVVRAGRLFLIVVFVGYQREEVRATATATYLARAPPPRSPMPLFPVFSRNNWRHRYAVTSLFSRMQDPRKIAVESEGTYMRPDNYVLLTVGARARYSRKTNGRRLTDLRKRLNFEIRILRTRVSRCNGATTARSRYYVALSRHRAEDGRASGVSSARDCRC